MLFASRYVIYLFLSDPTEQVIEVSMRHIWITAVPGVLYGLMMNYQQVLRGIGCPNDSVIGGFCQLIAKVALAAIGAWFFKSLTVVWIAWPVSYAAGLIWPLIRYRKVERERSTKEQNE